MKIYCSISTLKKHIKKWGTIVTDNSRWRWIKNKGVFIEECTARPSRFEALIKKAKILNSATEKILKRASQSKLLKPQISKAPVIYWKVIIFISKKMSIRILFFNIHFCQSTCVLYIQFLKVRSCQLFRFLKKI